MAETRNDSVVTCPVTKQRCDNELCSFDIGSEAMMCQRHIEMLTPDPVSDEQAERVMAGLEAFDDEMDKGEPSMSLEGAQATVALKTHPRVTKESIEDRIFEVRYIHDGTGTFCIIRMINSFEVNGFSKPADPNNYDLEVGKRYAYEDAFKKLWQLEGYRLCEWLYEDRVVTDKLASFATGDDDANV